MAIVRKVAASTLDERPAQTPALSPVQQARRKREAQFRQLLGGLKDPTDVYRVTPSDGETPATVRLSLLRVAKDLGREDEVIVRKHGNDGFLVGLVTPERQKSRRGRPPKRHDA